MFLKVSLLFFFLFNISLSEEKINQSDLVSSGKKVEVTLLIDEIFNIDISAGSFDINAEILLEWENNNLKINEPKIFDVTDSEEKKFEDIWYPKFNIVNEESAREISVKMLTMYPDGKIELFERFKTTLVMNTDIKEYPFGSLDLMLEIAAYAQSNEEMFFKPIKFLLGHDEFHKKHVLKGNWTIDKTYSVQTEKKSINFRGKNFSHNEYHFKVHHDYTDALQKILIPIFIIIIISLFINYFCRMKFSDNADFNINGQLVLLLTIVALRFSLVDDLPKTHYLNLTDLLFLSAYVVCTINLLGSIIFQYIYQNKKQYDASKMETSFVQLSIIIAVILITSSFFISF